MCLHPVFADIGGHSDLNHGVDTMLRLIAAFRLIQERTDKRHPFLQIRNK